MKKIFILFISMMVLKANAQNGKYETAMASTLQEFGQVKDANSLAAVELKFERIANVEKDKWQPYYYAALIKAQLSFMQAGNSDALADEASELANKAVAIQNNSELSCVKSMIATAKMLVDPQNRWMQYNAESNHYLEMAKQQDSTNPRPYTIQANNLINTPEQLGGGCKTALPLAQKASALYVEFKPANAFNPVWGKEMVEQIISKCR